jgi:hypothetical protein
MRIATGAIRAPRALPRERRSLIARPIARANESGRGTGRDARPRPVAVAGVAAAAARAAGERRASWIDERRNEQTTRGFETARRRDAETKNVFV